MFADWVIGVVLSMKHLEPWFNTTVCCGEIFKSRGKKVGCCKETGSDHV